MGKNIEKLIRRECIAFSDISKNSNKYYICELKDNGISYIVLFKYGRLGKKPIIKDKEFEHTQMGLNKAVNFLDRKYFSKKREGYTDIDIDEIISNCGEFL